MERLDRLTGGRHCARLIGALRGVARLMSVLGDASRSFGLWVAALIACVVGAAPVATLGLSVSGWLVFPLALASGGLLAALAASWVGNVVFAGGGTRSRLLPIVGWTELAAAVAFGLFALTFFSRVVSVTLLTLLTACAALIAAGAVLATYRLRADETHLMRDAGMSAGLLALALFVDSFGVWSMCATVLSCTP